MVGHMKHPCKVTYYPNGAEKKCNSYTALKKSNLKEMPTLYCLDTVSHFLADSVYGFIADIWSYHPQVTSNLKEMRIVRYADDFKIFCRTKEDAEKTYYAVKDMQ